MVIETSNMTVEMLPISPHIQEAIQRSLEAGHRWAEAERKKKIQKRKRIKRIFLVILLILLALFFKAA